MLRPTDVNNSASRPHTKRRNAQASCPFVPASPPPRLPVAERDGHDDREETTMAIKLINIGFGNIVSANRIISIVSPESAPIKRIIQEARDRHMLIDATYGRRTRAVIITDSDHVILSAVQPETVAHRLSVKEEDNDE
jgi:hypothetical protein